MKRLMGLLLAMMVMMGGMAGAEASSDYGSMQVVSMYPLAFSKKTVEHFNVTQPQN